jgi:Preprotein translocase subunit SecD
MPRRQSIYLVAIVLVAVTASALTAFWQNKPLLGLDLQGGVSVRLTATEPATEEMLDQAVEIIRKRVDALGVAEPEVSRTAEGVMVSLPGVDNQQRALELVGTTAELRFRPVCDVLPLMPADLAREGVARPAPASCEPLLAGDLTPSTGPLGVTLPEDDLADQFVVLGGRDNNQRYLLAPSVSHR